YPPPTLTISQNATAVTFTDAQQRTRTLQTSGKREPQTSDAGPVQTTTRWEGPQLVSETDLGSGMTMTHTYLLVPTTKQLLVRVTFERAPGQMGPFQVKYVYDRTDEKGVEDNRRGG